MSDTAKGASAAAAEAAARGPLRVDLGCGTHKRAGWLGVDSRPLPGVDVVADLREGLSFLADGSAAEVRASHFLEHLDALEDMLAEVHRVLADDGTSEFVVPHFSNPLAFSDYTHRRFFGLWTMNYFCDPDDQPGRKVPVYADRIRFRIESVRLVFRSGDGRARVPDRIVQKLVNAADWTRAFYEARLCWIWPCYEIRWVLRKGRRAG